MTRSTRLATLALSVALSSIAVDASAAGLFGWLRHSDDTKPTAAAPSAPAPTLATTATGRTTNNAPADLNSALANAQLSRKAGNYVEATKILSQLVLFAPDDPRVMGEYGKTLLAQGKADDAQAFLERAIQIQPSEWSFHSALGIAHDQKGEYPQAQAAYAHALALKPGESAVLNNAALSYLQSGDVDAAASMIQQAEATSTDKSRIQYTVALVERARVIRTQRLPDARVPSPTLAPAPESPAPAVVASVAPAQLPQPSFTPDPAPAQPVINNDQPVIESSALPPPEMPVEEWVDVTPSMPAPTLASLQANPTVVMQAVPKDDLAGPVQPRAEPKQIAPAAPKPAAETPPAGKRLAVSASPPLTTTAKAAPAPKAEVIHAYYVQAGAFATEDRADKLAATLDSMGARVSPTTVGGRSLYRVRIGPFKDAQQANDALDVAKSLGHTDVKVVTE